jgi:ABC-type transport system involved in multi-copper enzyme maturation permease subunit
MKFRQIFRYEFGYQTRRLSTWIYSGALFVFGFLIMRAITPADDAFVNTPSFVAFFTVIGGAVWLLLAAAVGGEAGARDIETGMHPLTYTAPISKTDYLGGRFFAAFVLNATMLLALQVGIMLSLLLPRANPELIGPFHVGGLLTPYLFIALPNAFVATAMQFSAAVLQRRAIAGYLASVLLIIASQVIGTSMGNLSGNWDLAILLDFVGFVAIVREMEAWTPLETNTRVIALEGTLLANRLLWIVVALGALAYTHGRFRFGHEVARGPWIRIRRRIGPIADSATEVRSRISIPEDQRTFGFATYARQTLLLAWTSFRTIAKSPIGLTVVGVLALGSALFSSEWLLHMEEIPLLARTEAVITFFTPPLGSLQTIWIIIPLLIVFYAGEVTWREREARVSEIVDTAPVPEWVLFMGKFLGLALVLATWMVFMLASGMLIQVLRGYPAFNIRLYLTALFGLQLADYLLFTLLVLVVHAVVNHKYLGHAAALAAFGLIAFAPTLGIEHGMLDYAFDPGWSYSDMTGFGRSLGPWVWFKLYWASWAVVLAVVAILLLSRGKEAGFGIRLQLARRRFTPATIAVTATAFVLVLAFGGFIFYNTNVLNAHHTAADLLERRAEYERRYKQYESVPQPRLTRTNLHVEIYPERQIVDIRATYQLVNDGAVAIDSVHVAPAAAVETGEITLDRRAVRVIADEDLRYRAYKLETPLHPGESLRLDFEVHFRPRGFSNNGIDPAVVANGTYFSNLSWLPAIGYQANREISSAADRRAHGLGPRPEIPSLYGTDAPRQRPDAARISVDAVIGTVPDEIAVGPGILRREWTEGGRRYFHYVTDAPIGNEYSVFSARYAVRQDRWNDVAIQIFHHPRHTENLERMIRSVQASLNYYTQQFGPYPYRHIRIVEYPGRARGMHADANTVTYQEGYSLLDPNPDRDVDLPYYVVAHEVAHQWWGTQVAPAFVEGAGLLVESLATYSAMRVVEETLGPEQLRRFLRFARLEYEIPRSRAQPPLLRATDSFLIYRKGPMALYALSEYIGKQQVHDALRRLLEKYGSGKPPRPTSLDLYRELQTVTPESSRSLLHDLFEKNTLWELEAEAAFAEQTASGDWRMTLNVEARKVMVDEAGVETVLAMDDWLEIGVFTSGEEGDERSKPSYLEKHRIRSGKQTITMTMPDKPVRAGIDPRYLLNDWEIGDNVVGIKTKS